MTAAAVRQVITTPPCDRRGLFLETANEIEDAIVSGRLSFRFDIPVVPSTAVLDELRAAQEL